MGKETINTLDEVVNSQPEVSGGVEGSSNENSTVVDNYGRPFDKTLHLVGEDGTPLLSKKGKLRVQKGKGISKISPKAADKTNPANDENYRVCAEVVVGTIVGIGTLFAGKDGQPNEAQHRYMVDSYERYFEMKGITDIPPGLAVFMATTTYAAPLIYKTYQREDSKLKKFVKGLFIRKPKEIKTTED